jgi:hypothetical protein
LDFHRPKSKKKAKNKTRGLFKLQYTHLNSFWVFLKEFFFWLAWARVSMFGNHLWQLVLIAQRHSTNEVRYKTPPLSESQSDLGVPARPLAG